MYIRLKYFRQNVKFSFGFEELKEFHSQKLILQIPAYIYFGDCQSQQYSYSVYQSDFLDDHKKMVHLRSVKFSCFVSVPSFTREVNNY